jgi:hypothetical protein
MLTLTKPWPALWTAIGVNVAVSLSPTLTPKFRDTVLDQKNVTGKSGTDCQVNGARKTYQHE